MRSSPFIALLVPAALYCQTIPSVTTYHNDNSRSGVNSNETQLKLSNVATGVFGKLFTYPVDGAVYAQPLYVPGVTIKGATLNIVLIATENNSLYAFDADTAGSPLWQVNFNYGPSGVTVTPASSTDVSCSDLAPSIGITSTPVIDLSTNTIYAVAKTKEVSKSGASFYHRLHGVNIATGTEAFTQVAITASVPGFCGNVQGANIVFNPLIQHQRAALLLLNHVVYIGSASHCDLGAYNGWLIGYDTRSLDQVAVLNTSPDDSTGACKGGIWQSGGGPAADALGNIYVLTGNGGFNANIGGQSYGQSLLKLTPSSTGAVSVADYFTPHNFLTLNQGDLDFGGSGVAVILNDQPGAYPHLTIASGKAGNIYLINRDSLGGYDGATDNAVQMLASAIGDGGTAYPPPVYFEEMVYYAAAYDKLKGFQLSQGLFNTTPLTAGSPTFGDLGAGLSVSSAPDGSNAIVWALEGINTTGVLHAYNAVTLAELYNTTMAPGGADNPGSSVKFSVPTVANGKVYIGTQSSVVVYGLPAETSTAPFGHIDTPANHSVGLAGAIGVTGWALSSVGIQSVGVWREPVSGETPAANGLVFVGNATMVPGTRPDIAAAYPSYPDNTTGWGLLVLTNELPNAGNGTFSLHVLATNTASQVVDLGTVTIGVDNADSVLPFGTIDTPAPGGTASGAAYVNFGWVLTPQPNLIPLNGSTIWVLIDKVRVGHPVYNNYRSDIATIFPGLQNSPGAVGYFRIDTTKLENGLHTISWTATDNAGHTQGLGSRFFTVQNTGSHELLSR